MYAHNYLVFFSCIPLHHPIQDLNLTHRQLHQLHLLLRVTQQTHLVRHLPKAPIHPLHITHQVTPAVILHRQIATSHHPLSLNRNLVPMCFSQLIHQPVALTQGPRVEAQALERVVAITINPVMVPLRQDLTPQVSQVLRLEAVKVVLIQAMTEMTDRTSTTLLATMILIVALKVVPTVHRHLVPQVQLTVARAITLVPKVTMTANTDTKMRNTNRP